jgi:hypothetical protein
MAYDYSNNLNPEKALIWRIVHRDNLRWILDNGLHSGNSNIQSNDWVHIGNPELTDKRARHIVSLDPGGYLNDYVPFYFTPFSVMLKNIHGGRGGVKQRYNDEIVILVSSIHKVQSLGLDYLFTNSHAYYRWATYYNAIQHLDKIDWPLLQQRDFKRDADDPAKFERYQAEALVHQHCPVDALLGIVCYTDKTKISIEGLLSENGINLDVHARPGWYF